MKESVDTYRLPLEELRKVTDVEILGIESTEDVSPLEGIIGQQRAVESISFGLNIKNRGYNLFVVGEYGSGRTTYTLKELNEKASEIPAPPDWLYAYNFSNPSYPIALKLPAGQGDMLAEKLDSLIEDLKLVLSKAFDNSQYEDQKAQLVKEFQESVNEKMEEVRTWALEKDFAIKRTPQGFVNIPMQEDVDEKGEHTKREMQQEDFEKLSEEEKKNLQEISEAISMRTLEALRLIRDKEKNLKDKIKDLEEKICRQAIAPYLGEFSESFSPDEKLGEWITSLTEDIIENFSMFLAASKDENAEVDFSRYKVNVFISNNPEDGAPVIIETNPTYYNTVGKIEYESRQGHLYTDFTKIIAGAVHKANGGFLVLQADDLFRQFMTWEALKRVLKTGTLAIENLGEQLGFVPVASLRPEPIEIDVKIVIIGSRWIYHLLTIYDPEFKKLFKIKADFDVDMPRKIETEREFAKFVAGFVHKEELLPFSKDAVGELVDWACRIAGHKDRMTTQFNKIGEVIIESSAWASQEKRSLVSRENVRKAIEKKYFRSNLIEEHVLRAYHEKIILVETEGTKIGQINGLAVVDIGDHVFGHPTRITANVFMGQSGVVNIEREVKLTGPIHNKGLLTLSSYLGRKYAQDMPLTLSARLAFEQSYDGIEGDSASSTELYCLLSALAEIPINQGIAVTGSVDQFGMIQPIGGANEKIEGFFNVCQHRGLTGKQGVLIPFQNVANLMLNHKVLDAVREGLFHVWAVSTIDEGIEILTGETPGEKDDSGEYPENSIHGKVRKRLVGWMERGAYLRKKYGASEDSQNQDSGTEENHVEKIE
ncbi:MAG TPA: ATP-binding protein [Synergistaceae bacterium]|nr:ATP-binding protein [Synergistaceae bacterium]HPJ25489.1 ATP-binding protein [Synergistaceae bacterium]HPQ36215.1 ATP-binding protein [Synergistaceae bacterium]